jgi:hypothetical protein
MTRIKMILGVVAVMAAMLVVFAAPAMADDWNDCDWDFCDHSDFDDGFDEALWIPEGTAAFDQVCSPGLPDGIWIPGCVFSDPVEDDDFDFFDDDVDFFVVDDDFDFDDFDHHDFDDFDHHDRWDDHDRWDRWD